MENNSITQTEHESARWKPLAMSFALHILSLVVLMVLVSRIPRSISAEPNRNGQIVLAVSNDQKQVEYLDESDALEDQKVPNTKNNVFNTAAPPVEFEKIPVDLTGALPLPTTEGAVSMTQQTIGVKETPYELTEADLEMIEADQKLIRSRQPKGPETTISVFGSNGLTGRRFVFLIDRSKSMGDQGLGVLRQAQIELTQAAKSLESHHEFQIVAYHNSTATISKRRLLAGSEENKGLISGFLERLVAYGGTNHENGLYAALAFRPDVIVMMTDGGLPELHDGILKSISRSANGTEIHTIKFGSGPETGDYNFLMKLASMTSGTYRYVDIRQWLKSR